MYIASTYMAKNVMSHMSTDNYSRLFLYLEKKEGDVEAKDLVGKRIRFGEGGLVVGVDVLTEKEQEIEIKNQYVLKPHSVPGTVGEKTIEAQEPEPGEIAVEAGGCKQCRGL